MRSFSQIYIMAVFGVKYRAGIIHASWKEALYAAIGQTLREMDGVMPVCIGGFKDHVHVLFSTRGNIPEAEIVRKIKTESTLWINSHRLAGCHFAWQEGGARISYSPSAIPDVKRYIENQEEHHRHRTFREEYEALMRKMGYLPEESDLPGELE